MTLSLFSQFAKCINQHVCHRPRSHCGPLTETNKVGGWFQQKLSHFMCRYHEGFRIVWSPNWTCRRSWTLHCCYNHCRSPVTWATRTCIWTEVLFKWDSIQPAPNVLLQFLDCKFIEAKSKTCASKPGKKVVCVWPRVGGKNSGLSL